MSELDKGQLKLILQQIISSIEIIRGEIEDNYCNVYELRNLVKTIKEGVEKL